MTMFQFSTGWNSTCRYIRQGANGYTVSIPNGMEFYETWVWSGVKYARFNSQRDGILHTRKDERRSTLRRFQFPTGWNSTGQQRAGVGDNT